MKKIIFIVLVLVGVSLFLFREEVSAQLRALQGESGGTGFTTTSASNVSNFLQVASTSPRLTYTFAAGGGSFTTTTINGISATAYTFATSTNGNGFTITTSSQTVTFNLPNASVNNIGLINISAQTLAGAKTFSTSPLIIGGIASTTIYGDGSSSTFAGDVNFGGASGVVFTAGGGFYLNALQGGAVYWYSSNLGAPRFQIHNNTGTTTLTLSSDQDVDIYLGDLTAGRTQRVPDISGTWVVGTSTVNRVAYFTALNTIQSDADLLFDGTVFTATNASTTNLSITSMTNGSILFVTSSGVVSQNNANLFWDNTNARLGIGTTTPATLFTVATTTNIFNVLSSGNVGIGTTTPSGVLSVASSTNGSSLFHVGGNGNVGIGTAGPLDLFHITTAISDKTLLRLENTNEDALPSRLTFVKDSASPAASDDLMKIDFYGDDSAGNSDRFGFLVGYASDVTNASEDGGLYFSTLVAGSAVRTMDIVGGNVGIGTSIPARKLHVSTGGTPASTDVNSPLVVSTASHTGITISTGGSTLNSFINFGDDASTNIGQIIYQHASNSFTFQTNGVGDRMVIDSSGNVGIGTTNLPSTATTSLTFGGTSRPTSINTNTAGIYASSTGSTVELFAFDGAGNHTQLSSHNPETGEYYVRSNNSYTGIEKVYHMERFMKDVSLRLGLNVNDYIETKKGIPTENWDTNESYWQEKTSSTIKDIEARITGLQILLATYTTSSEKYGETNEEMQQLILEKPRPYYKKTIPQWIANILGL